MRISSYTDLLEFMLTPTKFRLSRFYSVSGHLTLVCYEKFERIETSQFHFVLLNMIIIRESIEIILFYPPVRGAARWLSRFSSASLHRP